MTDNAESTNTDEIIVSLQSRNMVLEETLRETQAASSRRLIDAELKSEAIKNGMFDLDALKLVDAANVTINDQGNVEGAAVAVSRLRHAKPWLFRSSNSSSIAGVPQNSTSRTKHASDMTLNEWRTARADLLRRR